MRIKTATIINVGTDENGFKTYEVRCQNCGKLLFIYKNSKKTVDRAKQSAIIVARCTRNTCKTDNEFTV